MCAAPHTFSTLLAALTIAACGAAATVPPSADFDGGPETDGPASQNCKVAASLGDIGSAPEGTFEQALLGVFEGNSVISYQRLVDETDDQDDLVINLIEGFGVFESGFQATSVDLATELEAEQPSVIVIVVGDIQNGGQDYQAVEGTITLTEASATHISGTLSNVRFVSDDGACESTLLSASFDKDVVSQ
jgi:hypothetical protein